MLLINKHKNKPENITYFSVRIDLLRNKAEALGRKCYVRNWTVTKIFGIGTGDFRFRFSEEKGISFSSAFSFAGEYEKCIFSRSLHQTDSNYTLHQWFWNTQQPRVRTACRCLEKSVLPFIFDTSHPSSSSFRLHLAWLRFHGVWFYPLQLFHHCQYCILTYTFVIMSKKLLTYLPTYQHRRRRRRRRRRVVQVTVTPLRDPWRSQISTA